MEFFSKEIHICLILQLSVFSLNFNIVALDLLIINSLQPDGVNVLNSTVTNSKRLTYQVTRYMENKIIILMGRLYIF